MDLNKKVALTSPFLHLLVNNRNEMFDDDSDEQLDREIELIFQRFVTVPRVSIVNFFEEVVPAYSEKEFIEHFRISRDVFENIAREYEQSDLFQDIANQALVTPPDKSLAIFLWFTAYEVMSYRELSNLFNVALSTVYAIIRRVISFLSSLAPREIRWPTEQQMIEESEYHLQNYGIPGVIGAVDGTHIKIDPPAKNKDDYIDRKGDVSLVVQAVCNHQNNFYHISVGYPGSVHDARVFRCSKLPDLLDSTPQGYRILGDSAYPCRVKLMPPYRDTGRLTAAQKNFNYRLSSSRVMIEHSFGIIKQRFRQLYHCKLKGNKTLCHFIRACFVLHNMSRATDLEILRINPCSSDPSAKSNSLALQNDDQNNEAAEGKRLRDGICATLSSRRR